jgi:TonB-dependent starch-binding outer membrane protein SusC
MKKRYNMDLMKLSRQVGGIKSLFLLIFTFASFALWAQERSISGKITDGDSGEAVPGVTVVIKGTSRGTITDFDGFYKLAVSDNDILQVSFIGYQTQQVEIGARTVIDFKLVLDVEQLDEVVVVGYGAVQKKDLTGAVNPVSSKDFNRGVMTSPDGLLVGKVAGVQITPGSGEPGSASKITIRGSATIGAGGAKDDPLFVVDGVPIDNGGSVGTRNPLNFINPTDIETMTVLKDASATAIYGSRGAHGVIIITTKKGSYNQKSSFTYDGSYTVSQNIGDLGNLSPQNFKNYMRLKGGLRLDMLGTSQTNWADQVLQNATGQVHNMTLRGGGEDNNYRISIGHQELEGIVKTTNTDRTTVSINYAQKLFNDDLTITFNSKGAFTKDQFAAGVIGNAFSFDPTQAVKDPNSIYGGYYEWEDGLAVKNPVAELDLNKNFGKGFRSLGNMEMEYKIPFIQGLSVKTNVSYDILNSENKLFRPTYLRAESISAFPGVYQVERATKTSYLAEFYTTYKRDMPSINSSFDVTGGYSYQNFMREKPNYRLTGLDNNLFGIDAPVKAEMTAIGLEPVENRLISFFGRMNYRYMNRYIFTATLRRDGSTKFGGRNKWGLFPSGAFKWQLIDEPFLAGQSLFDDLGVRVGYGVTGSQEISDYLYIQTYDLSLSQGAQYQFGDTYYPLWRPVGVDPNIKWEETRSLNIGIDFGFMGGKVNGSVDIYQKNTTDLLNEVAFPAGSLPKDRVLTNIGQVRNQGIELLINTVVVDKSDFDLNISFNASHNQNEIVSLDNEKSSGKGYEVGGIAGDVGQTIQVLRVGGQINAFNVYEQKYLNGKPVDDQTDANGDGVANLLDMYVDRNNDSIINENDKRPYKSPAPKWMFGMTTSAKYKRFDFSATMRANLGNYIYNNNASNYGNIFTLINRVPNNVHESVLETNFNQKQLFSDYYVENASFLRLDNISLGYTLNLFDKGTLRMYSTVSNVFTLTGYSGQNPEAGSGGIDNSLYPFSRTMIFGATLNF